MNTNTLSRESMFLKLFPHEPSFRSQQFLCALFENSAGGWPDISTLPKTLRNTLEETIPWMSVRELVVLESHRRDTEKAILQCADGSRVETVLMKNPRGHWSVCVSSQVGCAMGCTFCATGRMGFSRNLTVDEIVDQVRFWMYRLSRNMSAGREMSDVVSNIVFMGMGEPLANYEAVRDAIRIILKHTPIGPTRITVSTVGLLPVMNRLIDDPLWPPVRLAVSLHSADPTTRRHLMPTSFGSFLDALALWTREYFSRNSERRRHLTFEHILIRNENDSLLDADKLIRFVRRVGKVKVNLIPYNRTANAYSESDISHTEAFLDRLRGAGVVATVRKAMGEDIAAACGQLITETKEN